MKNLSMQIRLIFILSFFFLVGMLGGIVNAWITGSDRVQEELQSSSELVDKLFKVAALGSSSPYNPETEPAFLAELIALENIRHIDIRLQSDTVDYPQLNANVLDSIDAPGWFVSLVYPEHETLIKTFTQSNGDVISIYADPGDEIEEIWAGVRIRLLATLIFLLLMITTTAFFVRRWMQPLESIVTVLDNVEQGDFSRRISTFDLPEFRRIGDRINHLTTWLGASNSENDRLTRKSIVVQEQERRYLAQELHDSLGQAVSAIKAIAVSIEERSRQTDPTCATSARNIEEIADTAYDSVRKMMTSLRPSVLDELGLTQALRQMVDDWNVHHEDTFCRLWIEGDYDNLHDEQKINLYRIVQEALTNISKYAHAEKVSINISGNEVITLLILDDGVGFSIAETTQNMGLTGIRDRVTLLRGELELASKPGKGVSIQIEFPRVNNYRRRAGDRSPS